MLNIGICLSGCGHLDGAEITESVLTLLHVDRLGARAVCMSIDAPQAGVMDHAHRTPGKDSRNCLVESARITRGDIRDVAAVTARDIDALVIPGGYGVAKNLCNWAQAGSDARPHPEVARLLREMHAAGKPIGAICIAPALVAAVFRGAVAGIELTAGDDAGTARSLESMGARHKRCAVTELAVDRKNRIVSTPAYMYDEARPSEVSDGIEKLVREVIAMCQV